MFLRYPVLPWDTLRNPGKSQVPWEQSGTLGVFWVQRHFSWCTLGPNNDRCRLGPYASVPRFTYPREGGGHHWGSWCLCSDVQHSLCDMLRVGWNDLLLAKSIQSNKIMMKFSLLWYEILSLEKHWGIKYKQSIQSLVVEIYLLKAPHSGMKFLLYLRLKNTPFNPHL